MPCFPKETIEELDMNKDGLIDLEEYTSTFSLF